MAFLTKGTKIIMDAYDYGLQIPFDITDMEFDDEDKMQFILKKSKGSDALLIKEYTNSLDSTDTFRFFLEFTEKEVSSLFPGNYVYYLKYIKDEEIRETLVSGEDFVIKK